MKPITTVAGALVYLPGSIERARGASLRFVLQIIDSTTQAAANRSSVAHSFALYSDDAVEDDTGVASSASAVGVGTTGGLHDVTIPAADMDAVEPGYYWGELECTDGETIEKYLIRVSVTGRGRQPTSAPVPSTDPPLTAENVVLCDGIALSNSTTGVEIDLPEAQASVDDFIVLCNWQEDPGRYGGELYVTKTQTAFTIHNNGPAVGSKIGYRAVKVVAS